MERSKITQTDAPHNAEMGSGRRKASVRSVVYGSQGANFTAGVPEREDASGTREAGDAVWETV
jgi:hypothetical protein